MKPESNGAILVVDDSIEALNLLNGALSAAGYHVFVAMDGIQAFSIAEKIEPDMILLDAIMPHMDGFETCRKIKQDEQLKEVPVIFMTGLTDSDNVLKGLEAGSIDYISKPINVDELIARVRVHLKQSRLFKSVQKAFNQVGHNAFICGQQGHIKIASVSAQKFLLQLASQHQWDKQLFTEMLYEWLASQPDKNDTLSLLTLGVSVQIILLTQPDYDEYLCQFQDNDEVSTRNKLMMQFELTDRESEVLYWLMNGKSNQEIAIILSLSPRTINKHLENTFRKMMVDNRIAAVAMCHQFLKSLHC